MLGRNSEAIRLAISRVWSVSPIIATILRLSSASCGRFWISASTLSSPSRSHLKLVKAEPIPVMDLAADPSPFLFSGPLEPAGKRAEALISLSNSRVRFHYAVFELFGICPEFRFGISEPGIHNLPASVRLAIANSCERVASKRSGALRAGKRIGAQ